MIRWSRTYGRMNPEQKAVWDAIYEPKNKAFQAADLQGKELLRWKYQRYIKDYLRCIASVDDNVGRLLRYLDATGLSRDTIVVYSSDQGFYLGEHGWFDKRWMYRESLRTPLLIRWPGVIESGSASRDLVSNLDYAATFLEIAGVRTPPRMQGRSLVPILKGGTPRDWRRSFYYHYYESQLAHGVPAHEGVRTERHKLIRFYVERRVGAVRPGAGPAGTAGAFTGKKGRNESAPSCRPNSSACERSTAPPNLPCDGGARGRSDSLRRTGSSYRKRNE